MLSVFLGIPPPVNFWMPEPFFYETWYLYCNRITVVHRNFNSICKIGRFKEFKTNYQWQGSRQRRWDIVTFLLAGTTYSQSYCCTGTTPAVFREFRDESPKRRSLKIRHLTANAHHNSNRGGPETHSNRNIHHLDVKNDVRSLETKFTWSKILIGEYEIVTNSQISKMSNRWNLGVWRSRNSQKGETSEFEGAHSGSFTCSPTLLVIGRKNCVTLGTYTRNWCYLLIH
jgi:hypothetical protein